MRKNTVKAYSLGPSGVNSVGYGKDRGVVWPTGVRPDGFTLRDNEEIISSAEYFERLKKQTNG